MTSTHGSHILTVSSYKSLDLSLLSKWLWFAFIGSAESLLWLSWVFLYTGRWHLH